MKRLAICALGFCLGFCSQASGQSGIITTVAGNGNAGFSGDGGPAISASLAATNVVVDASGSLFIADTANFRVRKVSSNGFITTVAGNGSGGFSGDGGPATSASLSLGAFTGLAVDATGNLFVADAQNNRIREISASGIITTVVGNGTQGFSGDGGPATSASLNLGQFSGLAVDASGNLFIADSENNRIRKVTANGIITTIAGNGNYGSTGDGGPATSASLTQPIGLALDTSGELFIADSNAGVVRKLSVSGLITTVAGNGCYAPGLPGKCSSLGLGDGGPATSAAMYPTAVALDSFGDLFIADAGNARIRKVSASGIITTVAGNGTAGFSGDGGPASSAALNYPQGVGVGFGGNLFIADTHNNRIREVSPSSPSSTFPSIVSVAPVDSTVPTIQPGEWVSIFGTNLASSTVTWNGDFPTSLGGTSVTINGKAAYLSFVSPAQINLQAPNDTVTGSVPVVVTTASGSATSTVTLAQFGPSFLLLDNKHVAGLILTSNGSGAYGGGTYDLIGPTGNSLGYPTVTAKAGDTIELFAVGLGPTNPAVPAGQSFSGAAPATSPVTLRINNVGVTPAFAGLSGAGLYQINLTVPAGLGTGDVSLVATVGGVQTPSSVVISLQAAAITPQVQSLTLSPNSVASGGTVVGTVVLSAAAPSGAAVVALSSSSNGASVPAAVTVPAGATSSTFTVSAGTVSSNQKVTITATYGGSSAQASLTVTPLVNSQCTNVGGTWNVSESGSYTETIAATVETDSVTNPVSGNGSATITQTGCSIQYNPISEAGLIGSNLTPSQVASLIRTGTVTGNNVTVTGLLALVDTVASAQAGFTVTNISTNVLNGSGQVAGNPPIMTLNETGKFVASGTYSINGQTGSFTETITTTSTATFTQGGIITTVAGNGRQGFSGDGGLSTSAELYYPYGVAVDASGDLFIADTVNNRIRKVSANGIITTVAGNGAATFSGDGGPATSASLHLPEAVAVDASGNLFIADQTNNRIRKVSAGGIITTVAGNGGEGFFGDAGLATSASLFTPRGVAVDASGNLFIADFNNNRIRKVSASGIITTVAGNGIQGFSGDSGPATSASLNQPSGVAVDAFGNLFIADSDNNRIRKMSANGIITTVAGNGAEGFSGDGGPANAASLDNPSSVAVDVSGALFITDYFNRRIREVSASGAITTVAGSGASGFSGDGGPATSASVDLPQGAAVDASGNLFIADYGNNRIREVSLVGAAAQSAVAPSTDLATQMGIRFAALADSTVIRKVVISLH